jgi:ABC-2 type transport system permease protein
MMAVNNLVFFTMGFVLFRKSGQLGGWSLEQTMVLFGVSATSFGFMNGLFGGFALLPELVRDGGLNGLLLRPRSTLFLVLVSKGHPSSWGDVISGLLLIYLSGLLTVGGWLLLPIVVMLSAVVFLSATLVYFCIAFWLERSDTLAFRLWETLIAFGLYPEGIFPTSVRVCLYTFLPAAFTGFVPVKVVLQHSLVWGGVLAASAVGWSLFGWCVFNRGVRRFVRGEAG